MHASETSEPMRSRGGSSLATIDGANRDRPWWLRLAWLNLLLQFVLLPIWLVSLGEGWLADDWRLAVEGVATSVGMWLGYALFAGLWCLLLSICRTVRARSVGVLAAAEGSSESETDWKGPFGTREADGTLGAESSWARVALGLALACSCLAVAAAGVGAPVVLADAAFEAFCSWLGGASLAGAFLWIRFAAAALRSRFGARQASEPAGESAPPKFLTRAFASADAARAWVWSAMACPPLLAALALAAPVLGIRRDAVGLGIVMAVKLVLAVAAVVGLYRAGRFLWRSGEALG